MVGLDGYAPSTSSMSMRHSTIELKALIKIFLTIKILINLEI